MIIYTSRSQSFFYMVLLQNMWLQEIFKTFTQTCPFQCQDFQYKVISGKYTHCVFVPFFFGVIRLPTAGREDVFVFFIPAPQNHFSCMRLDKEPQRALNLAEALSKVTGFHAVSIVLRSQCACSPRNIVFTSFHVATTRKIFSLVVQGLWQDT